MGTKMDQKGIKIILSSRSLLSTFVAMVVIKKAHSHHCPAVVLVSVSLCYLQTLIIIMKIFIPELRSTYFTTARSLLFIFLVTKYLGYVNIKFSKFDYQQDRESNMLTT